MNWYDKYVTVTTDEKWKNLLREVYNFASKNSNDISTYTAAMLVNNKLENLLIGEKIRSPIGRLETKSAHWMIAGRINKNGS